MERWDEKYCCIDALRLMDLYNWIDKSIEIDSGKVGWKILEIIGKSIVE